MHQHDAMSSERWVEPYSQGQAKETGLEKQQEEVGEEEELEVPCWDNQPAGSLRQEEELGRKWPSSSDHGGMEEVTSKRGVEQAQMEKIQTQGKRERFSQLKKSRECRDYRDKVQGLWRAKWDVKCDVLFEQNNKIHPLWNFPEPIFLTCPTLVHQPKCNDRATMCMNHFSVC